MTTGDDANVDNAGGGGTDARVERLLDRMTLAEKVGQCCGAFVGTLGGVTNTASDVEAMIDSHHVGSVTPFGVAVSPYDTPREAAALANRLQRHAVEETRLGIPLFVPVDAVHGHAYVAGATVFPHNLGLAATWNPDLAERAAAATAAELRATGATGNYAPTCDVARDQRWGRTFETFGESPRLCAAMAAAAVRGYQGDGVGGEGTVAATPKHFPAYGQPSRGEDAAPVDVSPTTLRRVFLPPFAACVDAGAAAVMPCYNSIDGEPAHGSKRYLDDLLRGDLGFEGVVLSDWNGVEMLHADHRVAADRREAVRMAVEAGVDVASIGGPPHAEALLALVEAGEIDEETLDERVRRVLSLKIRLGLFDDPYVDPDAAPAALGTDEHREIAYEAARQSMTLLKNDGSLPLSPDLDRVLVTGPNADDLHNQFGGWSVFEGPVPGSAPVPDGGDGEVEPVGLTVREGLERALDGDATVRYERGAGVRDVDDLDAVREGATDADAAVVVLGEGWYLHEFGPRELAGGDRGTFPTRSELGLPDAQRRLLRTVHETGTPTILVLVTGRPLSIPWAAERVPAILMAYYPGSAGGRAVADVLFGRRDPGGRLPVSIPRSTGHLPTRFNHLPHPHPIGDEEHPPSYDPLFAFGHGLSYAAFEYSDFEVSPDTIPPDGTATASVTVENVGERSGDEVVQLYLRDDVSSRVRPVRELCGFRRVALEAGEERRIRVPVDRRALAVAGPDGSRRVEPGTFTLTCGGRETTLTVET
ncbi:glycoside hydrolase family 3 N-terminal domain-containing protein [Halegenticoccus soli]|uniref:glycoside hydrolase family 3 N-terminal domain-containing protein n=1 Tax=Halegenticoccus soli TaxID=1985678 RepID=UPI000C6CB0DB|nr:glycoside hydrolase family 3 N-terminal domain-containing protein [Halegenticoccus soli]